MNKTLQTITFNMLLKMLLALVTLAFANPDIIRSGVAKRELNWNSGNQNIQSDENMNRNIRINYLRPSSKNDKIIENQDYMAFALYSKSSDTGTFYFVNSATVRTYKDEVKCQRSTMHELAYYHFFKKCPEKEQGLIASGFCYRGTRSTPALVYNSMTFNMGKRMSYLNSEYYKNEDGREFEDIRKMDLYEQSIIQYCYNQWRNAGFPINSWSCAIKNAVGRRKRAALGTCTSCSCDTLVTSSAPTNRIGITRIWCTIIMIMVTVFLYSRRGY